MPAPDRAAVRAYIGTNGTYSDAAIDSALAAEKVAQAKVCRVPVSVSSASDLVTIAAPNCESATWYGDTAYVEFRTVLCVVSGTIEVTEGFAIDGALNGDAVANVWLAGQEGSIDEATNPNPVQPLLNVSYADRPHSFDVEAGTEYTVALVIYDAIEYVGQIADFGALIEAINTPGVSPDGAGVWAADLLEALLRRTQRLLEMRSKPLGYQDTATEFGVASSRVGPDPEIRRLEAPYRKMVLG